MEQYTVRREIFMPPSVTSQTGLKPLSQIPVSKTLWRLNRVYFALVKMLFLEDSSSFYWASSCFSYMFNNWKQAKSISCHMHFKTSSYNNINMHYTQSIKYFLCSIITHIIFVDNKLVWYLNYLVLLQLSLCLNLFESLHYFLLLKDLKYNVKKRQKKRHY